MASSGSPWSVARALISRTLEAASKDELVDGCLDGLVELLGADRGVVLLGELDTAPASIDARGRGRALTAYEREEVSRSIVSEARRAGRPILWEPPTDGAPASAIALGIQAALVAPLRSPARRGAARELGVIYLDFRDPMTEVGATELEVLGAVAELLSLALDGELRAARAEEELRVAIAADGAPRAPALDELLQPRSMAAIKAELDLCLHADLPILMLGESGTGKTMLARAIAEASGRTPVVRATLGASDDLNTITSELFGHERGAFSGALTRRTGLCEFADKGTLILDEVLNLPLHAQQLLLDFTQFGTFRPLGWPKAEPKTARVRLVAATNGDLVAAIAAGRFREDLYHRIAAVTLTLPPLRERRDDLPALAEASLQRIDPTRGWRLDPGARTALTAPQLAWSGNFRRLDAVLQRGRLRALARDPRGDTIAAGDLDLREPGAAGAASAAAPSSPADLGEAWRGLARGRTEHDAREKALIEDALERAGGVVNRAAQELGIARTSLISRMQTLGIRKESL